MNGSMTWKAIQEEQAAWALRNFGPQPSWTALMGMVEEYGEALESITDRAKYLDAIADSCIYLLHYCTMKGWPIEVLWDGRHAVPRMTNRPWPQILGKLAHHELKTFQRIRGTPEHHGERGMYYVSRLLDYLEHEASLHGAVLLEIVTGTWQKVAKRDWTKQRPAVPQ